MATRQPKKKTAKAGTVRAPQLALPAGVSIADLGTTVGMAEAAARLGLSVKTVRRMISRGDFPHAHLMPMSKGNGEQWQIPVSDIEQHSAKQRSTARPNPVADELAQLRERVRELEQRADLFETLATERGRELEQLHGTMRLMLTAGPQRRWWRRGPTS